MSKAWVAYNYSKNIAMVVYADTKSRAKSYFINNETFDDYGLMDINGYRAKSLDYLDRFDGYIMDWNKDEDRVPMVKEFNMHCSEISEECKECCVYEWCNKYKEE